MSALVIEFIEVGRDKRSWQVPCPCSADNAEMIEHLALKAVQRQRVLMSREIDTPFDSTSRTGTVLVGGFRTVGRYTVRDAA